MHAELERRYRRLLWAYPRAYRRHRGDEMVGTLLDAAAPGQCRPTAAEWRDLIGRGLRCRFGIRGGWPRWVCAGLATFVVMVFGACAGNWWDWQDVPPLPSTAETTAIARTALPGVEPTELRRGDYRYGFPHLDPHRPWDVDLLGEDDYGLGYALVMGQWQSGHAEWVDRVAAARRHLRNDGWTIIEVGSNGNRYEDYFVARQGTLVIAVSASYNETTDEWMDLEFGRTSPSVRSLSVGVGAGLGLLVGWVLSSSLSRRIEQLPSLRRRVVRMLVSLAVYIEMPAALFTMFLLPDLIFPGGDGVGRWLPLWSMYVFPAFRPLALLGGVFALIALILAALPAHPQTPAGTRRGAARA